MLIKRLLTSTCVIAALGFSGLSLAKPFTLAFGSCAYDSEPQPIWLDIAAKKPDLFLFIGDNQYADVSYDENGNRISGPVSNPARFKEAYDAVSAKPEFSAFRATIPIMGTWDDHDYGKNDGGKEYALKDASQQAFLDFFGFAKDDPIRQQAGIYHSRMFNDEGHSVQVIMLDTRYHRDELTKLPEGTPSSYGRYQANNDVNKTLLGQAQWRWLRDELSKDADVRIIVSSIQVVAHEHRWETWGNMPHEKAALYKLIEQTGAENTFFLSGDRHLMEISKDTGQTGNKVPYPIWDFTASGLTQSYAEVNEANSYRVGKVVRDTHYGVVEIDWASKLEASTVTFTAYGLGNKIFDKVSFQLAELSL